MATVAPRSILNPAGPLVRRRRADRLSARAARRAAAGDPAHAVRRRPTASSPSSTRVAPARGTWWFLGWNRAYLRAFEAAHARAGPGRRAAVVGLDAAARGAARVLLAGRGREPNPLEAIDLPFRGPDRSAGAARRSHAALPTQADLRARARARGLPRLQRRLGGAAHHRPHVGRAAVRPGHHRRVDPLFWALQATVDRTWRLWQQRHPQPGPTPEEQEVTLDPFGVRFGEVLDTHALGYDYADLPRPRTRRAAAAEPEPWRPTLPGYISDSVAADPVDHLGIEPEVEALCWVIAARDTVPPLSVGLFGDWGSGKTTFMALMQARIREPRRAVRRSAGRARGAGRHADLVQRVDVRRRQPVGEPGDGHLHRRSAAPGALRARGRRGRSRRDARDDRRSAGTKPERASSRRRRASRSPSSASRSCRTARASSPARSSSARPRPGASGRPWPTPTSSRTCARRPARRSATTPPRPSTTPSSASASSPPCSRACARSGGCSPAAAPSATARSRSSRSRSCSSPRSSCSACSGSRSSRRSRPRRASPARSSRCWTPRRR